MSNSRKLLPYEHQLIDALGIEKEEYLAFIAQQQIYEDPKIGTVLDARDWPIVAIVLTVVGVLFQVAAALLAPRPEEQKAIGEGATRDEIFSPRYGFNSAQNLARYGDPVNLVYANTAVNPEGGVRVATSLLWSSMQSYGGSQLAKLLFLIGGGGIGAINPDRTAFGQTPFRDLVNQNYWLYFSPTNTGPLSFNNVLGLRSGGLQLSDPTRAGSSSNNAFRIRQIGSSSESLEGFSHAYSPTSAKMFGIYGVVPLNVTIIVRDSQGDVRGSRNGIYANVDGYWGESRPNNVLNQIPAGASLNIAIDSTSTGTGDSTEAILDAQDSRRALASAFDSAGVFKLGSAIFKTTAIDNPNLEARPLFAAAIVTQAGAAPSVRYSETQDQKEQYARPLPGTVNFGVKVLARIEEASYATVSPCSIVDFSIKARVYRRITGRQSAYGSEQRPGYAVSDNGIAQRTAMFLLKYKKSSSSGYQYFPGIFAIRRAADNDSYVFLRFDTGTRGESAAGHWQFKFEPVIDPMSEFQAHPELYDATAGGRFYYYLENAGALTVKSLGDGTSFEFTGYQRASGPSNFPPANSGPQGTREWDLFSPMSDTQYQFSFDQGPEMSLANITEQIIEPHSSFPGLYKDLSLFGLTLYSGKTIQDLRSLSVFVEKGRAGRLLATSGDGWGGDNFPYLSGLGYPCTAPDIFVDTILSGSDGIGRYASLYSTDLKQLAVSKKFCEANGFFMEGVIAEPTPWRQFWATNAGFSLLELGRVGGQDVLIPAVPYNRATGQISNAVPISALFNQGNILEDSYKEEFIDYGSNSQDIVVRVIYRKIESDGIFAQNDSVNIALSDVSEDYATQETIDASAFVTRRDQAIAIGKLLCLSKRYSRRAIEFKTFPTDSPVFPGAYIYVELAHNSWDRIYSGIVVEGGLLNTPIEIPDGNYSALCYKHGTNTSLSNPDGVQYFSSITISKQSGKSFCGNFAGYEGYLFVLGTEVKRKRTFKVTEVNMDEEGEVTIRAIEHITDLNGFSFIGQGMIAQGGWTIT